MPRLLEPRTWRGVPRSMCSLVYCKAIYRTSLKHQSQTNLHCLPAPKSDRLLVLDALPQHRSPHVLAGRCVSAAPPGVNPDVLRNVSAVRTRERQPSEHVRVEHAQPVKLGKRASLFVANRAHRLRHSSPPPIATDCGVLSAASDTDARPLHRQTPKPVSGFVQVPDWRANSDAFPSPRPFRNKPVILIFVSVDNIWDHRKVKRRIALQLRNPCVISTPVRHWFAALPSTESSVVHSEALADIDRHPQLIWPSKRHERMPTSDSRERSSVWCDRKPVVVNHYFFISR